MTNPASTNVKPLSGFNRLNLPDQLAVQLKANGHSYARISAALESSCEFKRSVEAIRDWFRPGGRLTLALEQYSEFLALESLKETVRLLMRLTLPAVTTLGQLLDHHDPKIRLAAAKIILDKAIPSISTSHTTRGSVDEPEIPAELIEEPQESDDGWANFLVEVRKASHRMATAKSTVLPRNLDKISRV